MADAFPRRLFQVPPPLARQLRGLSADEMTQVLHTLMTAVGYAGATIRAVSYDIWIDALLVSVLHPQFPLLPPGTTAPVEQLDMSDEAFTLAQRRIRDLRPNEGEVAYE